MRYTTEIRIQVPREKVIEMFDNTENLYKWQPGLLSFEPLSGEPGKEGSKSTMAYEGRKGDLVMIETITHRKFPDEFHTTYVTKGVYNEMYNYFSEAEAGITLWKTISVFRFKGLMALMAPFMKKAFTDNTLLSMERFKVFAEMEDKQ